MEYEEPQGLPRVPTVVSTDCTHIFPKSMDAGIEKEQKVSILFRLSGHPLTYATLGDIHGERLDNHPRIRI